mmetsp:Transcript_15514/g.21807  ORF Transcript_15514/g.21807 Transcript_15514/m.21807 type:complete len:81 (+) Transcript_15514:100-342(+)
MAHYTQTYSSLSTLPGYPHQETGTFFREPQKVLTPKYCFFEHAQIFFFPFRIKQKKTKKNKNKKPNPKKFSRPIVEEAKG